MRVTVSLLRGLGLDIMLVGLFGLVMLSIAVSIEYQFQFSDIFSGEIETIFVFELLEHVGLPFLLVLLPMILAMLILIRRRMLPLYQAAKTIGKLGDRRSDYRVPLDSMPTEVQPFARAINGLLDTAAVTAQEREYFAADVAHELRTPLAILALELGQLDKDQARPLKMQVEAINRLISQLMLMAQIESAFVTKQPLRKIALADAATAAISMMAPSIIAAGKHIALDGEENAVAVPMQQESIVSALRNLIENAERVTPVGGEVRLRIGPEPAIWVQDEGPGLSPERLRELSQRLRRSEHASHDGAGLGLAIVDRIIRINGGRLETRPDQREVGLIFGLATDPDR